MIQLFTDFGLNGPYVGQLRAAALRGAPEVPVIDLLHDAPTFRPELAAHLLRAVLAEIPAGDVIVAVVDPGVGTERTPLAILADGRWLVGPDNGLFELVLRDAARAETSRIEWRPVRLSVSFHGRDLFVPVAARLARGDRSALVPADPTRLKAMADDLAAVIYVDRYGNAMTGLRIATLPPAVTVVAASRRLERRRTFADGAPGEPFWYVNSLGLVELAVNGGSAAAMLGLRPGDAIGLQA